MNFITLGLLLFLQLQFGVEVYGRNRFQMDNLRISKTNVAEYNAEEKENEYNVENNVYAKDLDEVNVFIPNKPGDKKPAAAKPPLPKPAVQKPAAPKPGVQKPPVKPPGVGKPPPIKKDGIPENLPIGEKRAGLYDPFMLYNNPYEEDIEGLERVFHPPKDYDSPPLKPYIFFKRNYATEVGHPYGSDGLSRYPYSNPNAEVIATLRTTKSSEPLKRLSNLNTYFNGPDGGNSPDKNGFEVSISNNPKPNGNIDNIDTPDERPTLPNDSNIDYVDITPDSRPPLPVVDGQDSKFTDSIPKVPYLQDYNLNKRPNDFSVSPSPNKVFKNPPLEQYPETSFPGGNLQDSFPSPNGNGFKPPSLNNHRPKEEDQIFSNPLSFIRELFGNKLGKKNIYKQPPGIQGPEFPIGPEALGNGNLNGQPLGNGNLIGQPLGNGNLNGQPLGNGNLNGQPLENGNLNGPPLGNGNLNGQPLESDNLNGQPLGKFPQSFPSGGNQNVGDLPQNLGQDTLPNFGGNDLEPSEPFNNNGNSPDSGSLTHFDEVLNNAVQKEKSKGLSPGLVDLPPNEILGEPQIFENNGINGQPSGNFPQDIPLPQNLEGDLSNDSPINFPGPNKKKPSKPFVQPSPNYPGGLPNKETPPIPLILPPKDYPGSLPNNGKPSTPQDHPGSLPNNNGLPPNLNGQQNSYISPYDLFKMVQEYSNISPKQKRYSLRRNGITRRDGINPIKFFNELWDKNVKPYFHKRSYLYQDYPNQENPYGKKFTLDPFELIPKILKTIKQHARDKVALAGYKLKHIILSKFIPEELESPYVVNVPLLGYYKRYPEFNGNDGKTKKDNSFSLNPIKFLKKLFGVDSDGSNSEEKLPNRNPFNDQQQQQQQQLQLLQQQQLQQLQQQQEQQLQQQQQGLGEPLLVRPPPIEAQPSRDQLFESQPQIQPTPPQNLGRPTIQLPEPLKNFKMPTVPTLPSLSNIPSLSLNRNPTKRDEYFYKEDHDDYPKAQRGRRNYFEPLFHGNDNLYRPSLFSNQQQPPRNNYLYNPQTLDNSQPRDYLNSYPYSHKNFHFNPLSLFNGHPRRPQSFGNNNYNNRPSQGTKKIYVFNPIALISHAFGFKHFAHRPSTPLFGHFHFSKKVDPFALLNNLVGGAHNNPLSSLKVHANLFSFLHSLIYGSRPSRQYSNNSPYTYPNSRPVGYQNYGNQPQYLPYGYLNSQAQYLKKRMPQTRRMNTPRKPSRRVYIPESAYITPPNISTEKRSFLNQPVGPYFGNPGPRFPRRSRGNLRKVVPYFLFLFRR